MYTRLVHLCSVVISCSTAAGLYFRGDPCLTLCVVEVRILYTKYRVEHTSINWLCDVH